MSEETGQAPEYQRRSRSRGPLIGGIVVAAIVVIGLVVWGVTSLGNSDSGGTSSGSGSGSPSSLTVGVVLEPTSLDVTVNSGVATGQLLIDNVYQGLVGIEAGTVADIVPVLATDLPEVSDDGLTYTFTVRDGVTFHSGNEMTVDDVVTSLSETLVSATVGFDAEVQATSDSTVTITLTEPNNLLLWQLANFPGLIREAAATNNIADSANGTGPYQFEEWKQGDSLTLTKNTEYWGDEATLDEVVFRFFPEGRAAVSALQEGDLDVHTALLPSLRPELEGNANFELVNAASSDVFTLAYNSAKAPFDDPQVRAALSRAIDTEAIISSQNGDGRQIGGPITEGEPGYEDLTSVNAYDPEAARDMLDAAGQTDLELTVTVPNFYDTAPLDLIVSQLADVGVTATVNQVEFPVWLEQVYTNKDFDLSYVDHAEARDFGNYANPEYYFGYNSVTVQDDYASALQSTDDAETDELLQRAARQVADDAPAKWLYNYTPTNVIGTGVSGFPDTNTNARINLAGVTIDG